jgi:LPXTG-site transpeptidase (sortase) family protein
VFAAANLTITPITWNVIGLDSNNVNVGPNHFPVGARVCNTGDVAATNLSATFIWDTSNSYINIRPGTSSTLTVSSLAAGSCTDFYFEVEITRNAAAYDTTRDYHITVTATGGLSVSTPTPRTLYVEHLVSQSRNAVTDVQYGTSLGSLTSVAAGGTMTLVVGNTYYIKLIGFTATNGYEQLESFINFPNTIFQVLSVNSTYTADTSAYVSSPNDKAYGDACKWENDPGSPNYRACLDVGKVGGNITVTYQVKILQVPATNPEPLSTLVYDFSGSSYHYNSDFSASTRYAYIVNASLTKSFSPKTINPGGTSTLTFVITNPGTTSISSVNFTDNLPSNVTISGTTVTYSGCGGSPSPSTVTNGATSLSFSNITVSGLSTCTIGVTVTSSTNGTYNNTTSNLLLGTTDTGSSGSDTLVVSSQPAPPSSCTTPSTIATWTMPTIGQGSGGPPPPYTTKASDVSSATASAALTGAGSQTINAAGNPANDWNITDAWSTAVIPPGVASGPYFQFSLDTSNYGGAHISFDFDLEANGDWASNTNNHIYIYSSADGTTYSLVASLGNANGVIKGTWVTGVAAATAASTSTSTTYFRVTADSRSGSQATSSVRLDNVTITGCPRPIVPTMSKSFSPTTIGTGTTSTLTFTLTNPNTTTSLTGVSFSDVLPSGLTVTSGTSAACGTGTLTRTSPRTISLSGGTLAASGTCTINVTVTGATAGAYTNTSSSISSTETGPNTTGGANVGYGQANLTVIDPPVIAKSFTANPIFTNGTTTLSFTITNPNTSTALTGVNFSDSLPSGLVVDTPNGLSNTCGGTATAIAGSSTVSLSGVSLAASSSCTVSVSVKGTTAGLKTNSVTVTSTNGGTGNTSTADVLVKDATPLISLLKQVGSSSSGPWTSFLAVSAGANVYYKFTVENTGDVALTSVNVSDPTVSTAGCSWTDGDGTPLAAPFNLPVADANDNQIATCVLGPFTAASGSHPNTATASGTYNSTTVTDTSTATYGTPALTLVKSVTESNFTTAGNLLHYSYLVTNSGYVSLLGPVTVTDDKATVTCPAVSTVGDGDAWLDVGESLTCTATYTVTAGDVTTGSVTNTASATAGGTTSNTDSKTVSVPSDLTVTKTNNVSGSLALGGAFNWTITVSNASATGLAVFTNGQTILSDSLPAGPTYGAPSAGSFSGITNSANINCTISSGTLSCTASGASVTIGAGGSFAVSFSVTPASAGSLSNTATVDPNASVTETNEANNTGSDTVTVVAPPSISKNFSPDPIFVNGTSVLTFTITNPNTGTALTGVGFTDALPAGLQVAATPGASTSVGCGSPTFSPAAADVTLTFSGATIPASGTCTVTVNVTGTTAGLKNNTSGAVTSTNGGTGNTASDTLTVNPLIDVSLDKQVDNAVPDVGSAVTFTLVVANAGPSAATNVVVTDVVPSGYAYVASSIAGGDSRSDANPATTGLTWTINSLASSASVNLTYQATVLASGAYDNYAEITSHTETDSDSVPGNGSTTEDDDDVVTVTPTPVADLAITKTDGVTTVISGGSTIYTVRVTNNGPSSVSGAVLSDPAATGLSKTAAACSATPGQCTTAPTIAQLESGTFALPVLASGAFYEITVTADVTAASGSVTNTASVAPPSGTTDSDNTNNSADDTDTVSTAPSMTVEKSSTTASLSAPGTVTYSYLVTNTGNAALTGISLTDDNDNNDTSCPSSSLAVGANMNCTATHTFTQSELDANGSPTAASGNLSNNVTASSNEAPDATDNLDIPISQNPAMTVVKSSTTSSLSAPGTVNYSYLVTNTGNVTLTGIFLADDNDNNDMSCLAATLAPSASTTCSATHTFTQAELNANGSPTPGSGELTNNVTASSNEAPDATDTLNIPITQSPAFTISKSITSSGPYDSSGDIIAYQVLVTNTGNVTLTGVSVSDPLISDLDCDGVAGAPYVTTGFTINVGSSLTCTGSYALTQADLDNNGGGDGDIDNTVTGDTDQTPSQPSSAAAPLTLNPFMTVVKSSVTVSLSAPATVTYSYLVTNTGNVTLTGISLSDDNDNNDMSCPGTSLAPSGTMTCSATHTFSQAQLDAGGSPTPASGQLANNVTASSNEAPDATDDLDIPITQNPALTIAKSVTEASYASVGTVLHYSYLVTNSGNVTLTGPFTVTDDKSTNETCPATASLAPAASITCSATYTVTQADLDSGSVTNIAAAHGFFGGNPVVSSTDTETVPAVQNPALTIVKSVTETSFSTAGDVLHYSYLLTNSGNVTLDGPFTVADDKSTDESCPAAATLAPGASITCTATYTILPGDVSNGSVTNTASATGSFGGSPVTSNTDSQTVNSTLADLSLTKTVDNPTPSFGALVKFTITVTNSGPDTATGVHVSDVLPSGFTFSSSSVTQGSYTSGSGDWNVGTLALNASATLEINASVNISGSYDNTAQVSASAVVDPNSTPANNDPTEDDQASASVAPTQGNPSGLSKTISATNQAFTTGTNVAIGELVTYQVSVTIPPGTFPNAQLVDTMVRGLAFVNCQSISGTGLSTSIGTFADVCNNAVVDDAGGGTALDVDRRVTFDFGTLTNSSGSDKTLTITYQAVVLDISTNVMGVNLSNTASWTSDSGSLGPATATVHILEPKLTIAKAANVTFISDGTTATFTLTIAHAPFPASQTDAFDVVLLDALPSSLTFVGGSLDCTVGLQDPDVDCSFDSLTNTVRAEWSTFTSAGGFGRIRFTVMGNNLLPPGGVTNVASVEWTTLPGVVGPQSYTPNTYSTERVYDPNDPASATYRTSASLLLTPLGTGGGTGGIRGGFLLPLTGFAYGRPTDLSDTPQAVYDDTAGLTLEIPVQGTRIPIIGVRLENGSWNLNWLWDQAGWLEKTAYPSWQGNSVLTAHVVTPDGKPGPFYRLNQLRAGDQIIINSYGYRYIYIVRSVRSVAPDDITVLRHEDEAWLTLLTCDQYDDKTGAYLKRIAVSAELVQVQPVGK